MDTITKKELIRQLKGVRDWGWVKNRRIGNSGGVGNTLEDLLGIEENNLPLPNAGEWELKCQMEKTSSMTTLFHMEPSPRKLKFVPQLLLPKYGWPHKDAGSKYNTDELSFRQTITAGNRTNRGFGIIINDKEKKIEVSFDSESVSDSHQDWLKSVEQRVGLDELDPRPYWGYMDLFHKTGTKLHNCFYVVAESKKVKDGTYYRYSKILMLQTLSIEKFIKSLKDGDMAIDFDARTGHNHGTKFRLRKGILHKLYEVITEL